MARADAYVALYPFLSKATLPRGVGDLAKDLPPADVTLFASKASLVVRKDFRAAIQYLLLSTAVQIHSGVGMFHRAGRFPAAEGIELPLSSEAVQFYKFRAAVPAAQSSVLDGVAGRTPARPAHPDRRRAVPDDAVSACFVWLVDAPEDRATVRRAEIPGGRDHRRRRTNRCRSADGAPPSAREAGKPAQDADRL